MTAVLETRGENVMAAREAPPLSSAPPRERDESAAAPVPASTHATSSLSRDASAPHRPLTFRLLVLPIECARRRAYEKRVEDAARRALASPSSPPDPILMGDLSPLHDRQQHVSPRAFSALPSSSDEGTSGTVGTSRYGLDER
jgi:hypothetical protein